MQECGSLLNDGSRFASAEARLGVFAIGTIKRKNFGLFWNVALETAGTIVGDKVSIWLDVQFVQMALSCFVVSTFLPTKPTIIPPYDATLAWSESYGREP
jgi:hypothetical protein